MITIKNRVAFEKMTHAGHLLALLFEELNNFVVAGCTTLAIESYIAHYQKTHNLVSCMKGYRGYQYVSCISINDEVVHGMPSPTRVIQEDDLVKIDVCASYKGYCADMARCFSVGSLAARVQQLIKVTYAALDAGIEKVWPGNYLSDVSAAIQSCVERDGFGVVRDFAGHGIGKKMHEEPEILNYGKPGKGPVLRHGMSFALEPMTTMGDYRVYIAHDGWTVKTVDKSFAAHVEDTVLVTDNGPQIVTRL